LKLLVQLREGHGVTAAAAATLLDKRENGLA
jgi:hypothetical protein